MNAVRLMVKEEQGVTECFNLGTKRYIGIEDLLADELDTRDWILTPEVRSEVTQFESNFNIAGNPAGIHIRLTHSLKTFFKSLQCQYPPAMVKQIGASIFQCFNVFFTNLSSYPMGRARAIAAYELLDREFKISANKDVTCQKGCAACCNLQRDITNDEADLLAFLIKNGVQIDMQLLKKQVAMSGRDKRNGHIAKSAARCIFLGEDNLCMIYEYRPNVCRKYAVTSPPKECRKKGGIVNQVPLIAEEVLVSAALSCRCNHHGLMSDMLGAALKIKDFSKPKPKKVNLIRIRSDSADKSPEFQWLPRSNKLPTAIKNFFIEK